MPDLHGRPAHPFSALTFKRLVAATSDLATEVDLCVGPAACEVAVDLTDAGPQDWSAYVVVLPPCANREALIERVSLAVKREIDRTGQFDERDVVHRGR